ncbi:MAG TPA: NUDIX hydrolase [Clostridiales bacterium]|jgi:ADP-ribose pyrophosphatase YjhB (NUDIX family)|nr:NUDIX hydrolase [Clostridiales bacterium]
MWQGGVRIIIRDKDNRVLLLRQEHEERSFWLLPGGAIETGETAGAAAIRETAEETGLIIEPLDLRWFVEEVSEVRGQRFVLYFESRLLGGTLALGSDPELSEDDQVLRQARYFTLDEMIELAGNGQLHPAWLAAELSRGDTRGKVYRIRDSGIQ